MKLQLRTKIAILSAMVCCVCIVVFSFILISFNYIEYVELEVEFTEALTQQIFDDLKLESLSLESSVEQDRIEEMLNRSINDVNISIRKPTGELIYQSNDWDNNLPFGSKGIHYIRRFLIPNQAPIQSSYESLNGLEFTYQSSLNGVKEEILELIITLLLSLLPASLVAIFGGLSISREALNPVQQLCEELEALDEKKLNKRIKSANDHDEIGRLLIVFNDLLSRLETSFNQAIRFSADASHELRTPISILKMTVSDAIKKEREPQADQKTLYHLQNEISRISHIIDNLLLLTKADSGQLKLDEEIININDLITPLREDLETEGLKSKYDLKTSIPDSPLYTLGDPILLMRVFENIVDNAIKYNMENGFIRLNIWAEKSKIKIELSNSGLTIPPEIQSDIFLRFSRGNVEGNQTIEGYGLGLSLSDEILKLHGGKIELTRSDIECTTFLVTLKSLERI